MIVDTCPYLIIGSKMLLFIENETNKETSRIYNSLVEDNRIDVLHIGLKEIVASGYMSLEFNRNFLRTSFQSGSPDSPLLELDTIKVCFMPQPVYLNKKWFNVHNVLDSDYAMQEWWAAILAFLEGNPHIKFVNPKYSKADLHSEFEQHLLYRKFGIQTTDALLTNDAYEAIRHFNLWNQQALLKSVRSGYDTAKCMTIEDLARIDKLKYCPVQFHKSIYGQEVLACVIGNQLIAGHHTINPEDQNIIRMNLPESLQTKLLQITQDTNFPIVVFNLIYSEDQDDYFGYAINLYPAIEGLITTFGNELIDILTEYLVQETLA